MKLVDANSGFKVEDVPLEAGIAVVTNRTDSKGLDKPLPPIAPISANEEWFPSPDSSDITRRNSYSSIEAKDPVSQSTIAIDVCFLFFDLFSKTKVQHLDHK